MKKKFLIAVLAGLLVCGSASAQQDPTGRGIVPSRFTPEIMLMLDTPTGAGIYCNSKGDFTATCGANKVITLAALNATIGTLNKNMIRRVVLMKDGTNVVSVVPLTNISVTGNAITLSDASANFAVADKVIVWLQAPDQALNKTTNSYINSILNPIWSRYTTVISLCPSDSVSHAGADSLKWHMQGSEIETIGYPTLSLFTQWTVGSSTGLKVRVRGRHTTGGTAFHIGSAGLEYAVGDSSHNRVIEFDLGGIPYVIVETITSTLRAHPTVAMVTIDYVKKHE